MPPPESLERFNEIVADGAERIMRQWEAETAHRRQLEQSELRLYGWSELLGKVFAFVFVVGALVAAVYMASVGAEWAAAILGMGTIASVVWAFVKTRAGRGN